MTHGSESSLQEVTHSRSGSFGLCVTILDTGELQKPLRGGGSDDASSPWSRDETTHDRSYFSADFRGNGVRIPKLGTPVTSSDGDDGEFREGDSTTNCSCDFLCALDTQTNVTIEITDSNEGLESRTLTCAGLLLNRHDLHDLVFEFWEERVDDLVLLNRERKEVDFLQGLDLSVFHEAAKFCDGGPLIPQVSIRARS